MCGIAGLYNLAAHSPIEQHQIRQMLAMLRHRGPDQFGLYLDKTVGLGNARLSVLDLKTGQQPISNEDGSVWIVLNGEIFNYVELRPELEALGHQLVTQTDTEVLVHLYEEYGPDCLSRLNGQFAMAIWDGRNRTLFLARDRLGVRPLYYTVVDGVLVFGSEIKAVLADPRVRAEFDPVALDQIFTYWSPLSPRTAFKNIFTLPPGHFLVAHEGALAITPYWRLEFPDESATDTRRQDDCLEAFRALLIDATRIRLRADVPVGAYLSGGLDSSVTAAIIRNFSSSHLDTFSIAFSDANFDESQFQQRMADHLGTNHHVAFVTHADIGCVFPDVIWHTEIPILRTSPAPMFLLSRLVRDHQFKVVLTGEGADEFLAGYDIFKEMKIRRFWARKPESDLRALLLQKLYPDIPGLKTGGGAFLTAFFKQRLAEVHSPFYSHLLRWVNTSRIKRFFSEALRTDIQAQGRLFQPGELPPDAIDLPPSFDRWHPLHRAQYLEITMFLSEYLLSSQGDRVGMAHSVEGRFPFLDYRLVEFANHLPPRYKLHGLTEKYLLKKLGREWLPDEIWQRVKRPYRAPIHRSFFNDQTIPYVREMLSPAYVDEAGLFNSTAVSHLVKKIESHMPITETDDMALAGILSSHLIFQQFVSQFRMPPPLSETDDVKICHGPDEGD